MLSVGELLRKQRIKKGYSLPQIEKQLKVREKFLTAIENNNWQMFSSKIYITGIIKNYARLLNLDEMKVIAFFRREYEKSEDVHFKKKVASHYLSSDTKKAIRAGVIGVFALFLFYFGYQIFLYVAPPKVLFIDPKGSVFKRITSVKIIGKTEKEASIMIFGERIYQNKEGFFEYNFPLKTGKNVFTVEVTGANGKKTKVSREFILRQ